MSDFEVGVDALDELKEAYEAAQEYRHKSRFAFLRELNGLRPSCISCLLGITSAGKSTLLKAIVSDTAQSHKVLIWLTEEARAQYSVQIVNASLEKFTEEKRNNMVFFQESKKMDEIKKINRPADAAAYIIDKIILSGCDVVFFDNMTTSSLYDKFTPQGQAEIAQDLRAFIESSGKAFLYLAHTQKGINKSVNRLLGSEDIQGSSMLAKVSQYFFVLQTFDIGKTRHAYITTTKHRQHSEVKNTHFMLKFEQGRYSGDIICDFEQMAISFHQETDLKKNKGSQMKITSGDFEQFCFCFNFNDMCKIRFKRLLPEHRKEVYLSKVSYLKFKESIEKKDFKKARIFFKEYTAFEDKEWVKKYDFPVGIELVDLWKD